MRLISDFVAVIFFCITITTAIDFRYHRYEEMVQLLKNFTTKHSNLSRLYSIGKSIKGRELYVVELTAVNGPTIGVPNVKLVGNIHGNEAVGREILLHFLQFMVDNYQMNSTIRWYLENTRLHILPSLNPDGFEMASMGLCDRGLGRENANKTDLNRSFPDFFRNNQMYEPETEAVQRWMKEIPFILSASLHGGALVANYPFENSKEDTWELALRWFDETQTSTNTSGALPLKFPPSGVLFGSSSISPDDDVFQHLASLYANRHPSMHEGVLCPGTTKSFEGGITNGAAWYKITGGMQDYNYAFHGCMEITLEISCCKYPIDSELPQLWEENKLALLDYILEAHRGIKGVIIDGITKKPVANATLNVVKRDINFYSTNNGEFWRILRPGQYILNITANGYENKKINFTVTYPKPKTLPRMLTIQIFPPEYKDIMLTTDGGTDHHSNENINPIANKIVRTLNNSNDIIVEHTAEVISRSFLIKSSVFITWFSFLFALSFI